ncbi:hypothetical protein NDU88_003872 [Pleurodeles waltl]|uniref:Uncharacterized protein n=1 Tax=Pleurodeles waltl TaxID=8319 RepID=A0AAV7LI61_PLEWA|nr:hypothetical protein NDU88_003872 [Pleurodeles waltl]
MEMVGGRLFPSCGRSIGSDDSETWAWVGLRLAPKLSMAGGQLLTGGSSRAGAGDGSRVALHEQEPEMAGGRLYLSWSQSRGSGEAETWACVSPRPAARGSLPAGLGTQLISWNGDLGPWQSCAGSEGSLPVVPEK